MLRRFSTAAPRLPPFFIVDSTLREGEQFSSAEFTSEDRVYIAKTLDKMGIDYIEVQNPIASSTARREAETIATKLRLRAKVLAHVRCHKADVGAAIDAGVQGVNVYMATSAQLSRHSHGKNIDQVIEEVSSIVKLAKQKGGLEVRFSCEDAFRSDLKDIVRVYREVDKLGVDRVGVADTVGIATPRQVYDTIAQVRSVLKPTTGIEFHTHNDTGCAVANAYQALEAGATHIDTCVLGIGERNGITPLGSLLARMYTLDRDTVMQRYNLKTLSHLEKYVAQAVGVSIPFNNVVTGPSSFTHKAGVHSKAVLQDPGAYEVIDPEHFGAERFVQVAHRLSGWNAIASRAKTLSLDLSDDQLKAATGLIKNLADERPISLEQVDNVLLQLAQGPRTSSSMFVQFKDNAVDPSVREAMEQASKALEAYERAAAKAAVDTVKVSLPKDVRESVLLEITGHLFDKAVMNRCFDLLVDSKVEFKVTRMDVAPQNELPSSAQIRIWGESAKVVTQLSALIETMQSIADTSLRVIPREEQDLEKTTPVN